MAQWVDLCGLGERPAAGSVAELSASGVQVCLANHAGELAAVDNVCPHRAGPLSEGWLEDGKVVCPWHAWAFDLKTGECPEERSRIRVYPLREENGRLLIDIA